MNIQAHYILDIAGVRVNQKHIGSVRSAASSVIKIPTFGHALDVGINSLGRCMVGTVGAAANRKHIGNAKHEDSKQGQFESGRIVLTWTR